jgi:hypothetical protein
MDTYAHIDVMANPKIKTDAMTINNVCGVMISINCGSYFTSI